MNTTVVEDTSGLSGGAIAIIIIVIIIFLIIIGILIWYFVFRLPGQSGPSDKYILYYIINI